MRELTEQRNRFLRVVHEGQFSGGDRYKDFELLVDAPEITATRSLATPQHAVKGDKLREREDDDDLTPFELRRDGKRIGDPEWWQVRHLFDGLYRDADPAPASDERTGLLKPGTISLKNGRGR